MSIVVGKKYVLQNVFTRNLIAKVPDGPGPAGLCGWSEPWVFEAGQREWKFELVDADRQLYKIVNVLLSDYRIYAHAGGPHTPGEVGATDGGPNTNQQWQPHLVGGGDNDVYYIGNQAGHGYLMDNAMVGETHGLNVFQPLDPFHEERYQWKLIPQ